MSDNPAIPTPTPPSLAARLSNRFGERLLYSRRRDFFWSLYNRLLERPIGRLLPGRGALRSVLMNGMDRPLFLRLRSTDWLVAEEILRSGEYDVIRPETLGQPRQIVDLGANVGLSVRLWQKRFPDARILAVEADDANVALCRRNASAGERPERVTVVQACVSGTVRPVVIDRAGGDWAFTIRDASANAASSNAPGANPVSTRLLDDILTTSGFQGTIDVLKCDIEGAEQDLFANCAPWIQRVRNLIIELHPPYEQAMFLDDLRRADAQFSCRELFEGIKPLLFLQNMRYEG